MSTLKQEGMLSDDLKHLLLMELLNEYEFNMNMAAEPVCFLLGERTPANIHSLHNAQSHPLRLGSPQNSVSNKLSNYDQAFNIATNILNSPNSNSDGKTTPKKDSHSIGPTGNNTHNSALSTKTKSQGGPSGKTKLPSNGSKGKRKPPNGNTATAKSNPKHHKVAKTVSSSEGHGGGAQRKTVRLNSRKERKSTQQQSSAYTNLNVNSPEPVPHKVQHQNSGDSKLAPVVKLAPVDNRPDRPDKDSTAAFPPVKEALPVFQGTDKNMLSACLENSRESYNPGSPSLNTSSPFAEHARNIATKLTRFIKGEVESDQTKAKVFYVCGPPGVGKTMGVKWACSEAFKSAGVEPNIAYIKAADLIASRNPCCAYLKELAKALGLKADNQIMLADVEKKLVRPTTPFLVVIVDEVDLLVSAEHAYEDEHPKTHNEDIVHNLNGLSKKRGMAFIGISNCINGLGSGDQYIRVLTMLDTEVSAPTIWFCFHTKFSFSWHFILLYHSRQIYMNINHAPGKGLYKPRL
jgi:hypothetical protein